MVDSPTKMPKREVISKTLEPYVKTSIFSPTDYIGPIMELCQDKRGTFLNMEYLDQTRVTIHYELPLSEIVIRKDMLLLIMNLLVIERVI